MLVIMAGWEVRYSQKLLLKMKMRILMTTLIMVNQVKFLLVTTHSKITVTLMLNPWVKVYLLRNHKILKICRT